jgi:hypothetical protein
MRKAIPWILGAVLVFLIGATNSHLLAMLLAVILFLVAKYL